MVKKNEIYDLFSYWKKQGLSKEPLSQICARRIKDRVKELGKEFVKEAIKNYSIILSDRNCNCERYSLCTFMTYKVQDFIYLDNAYNLYTKYEKPQIDEEGYLI
jgi:hypothetical protein